MKKLSSFMFVLTCLACQQKGFLKNFVEKPNDKKETTDSKEGNSDSDEEKVTPPSNIVGSYLYCNEQEQIQDISRNSRIACGLYDEPAHKLIEVARLDQWQLSGTSVTLSELVPGVASRVVMNFQAADENGLRAAVKGAVLTLTDNAGRTATGSIAELLPQDDRLATAAAGKTPNLQLLWNEGFEATQITTDFSYYSKATFSLGFRTSLFFDWTNLTAQNTSCGSPTIEVLRFATHNGTAVDTVGAAEGNQFIETDSVCFPNNTTIAADGASNLSLLKDIELIEGKVYRVSFKVRQPPLPRGVVASQQSLQFRINKTVLTELTTLGNAWQEVTFDWVAGNVINRLEWVDNGSANDSIGVLLDDLRVQAVKY